MAFTAAASEHHLVEGALHSPVRVIIYEDLQCPDCAGFRKMLDQQILPKYGSSVRFEHRDLPLHKHSWARKAAIAAKFFEEQKPQLGLAYRQYAMTNLKEITPENFNEHVMEFAREHRVNPVTAAAALEDTHLSEAVESDRQEGISRGVSKTPTVLVNGQPFVERFAFEEIAKSIDAELARAK